MPPTFFEPLADGVRLYVRLTPKARAERVEGVVEDGDGHLRLKVTVTAPPEDGKANAALIALLSKKLKVGKSSFELESGATSRQKNLLIAGDVQALVEKLQTLPV